MVLFCTALDISKTNKMNFKKPILSTFLVVASLALFTHCSSKSSNAEITAKTSAKKDTTIKKADSADTKAAFPLSYPPIDHAQYDALMKKLANGDTTGKWPVKNTPYPLPGAILPYKRVVAFYGNLSAKKMGILGEIPPDQMLAKLRGEAKRWEKADPTTPTQLAL